MVKSKEMEKTLTGHVAPKPSQCSGVSLRPQSGLVKHGVTDQLFPVPVVEFSLKRSLN